MTPRTSDKRAKRRQILAAALRVVARKGMHGFRMIEIAEEAAVGKGTLYEYFPSKENMLSGVFEMFFTEFLEYVRDHLAGAEGPDERLYRYVASSMDFLCERADLVDGLFDFYAGGIPRKDGASPLFNMSGAYRDAIDDLSAMVDEGIAGGQFRKVDSRFYAATILATIDGLWFQTALKVTRIKTGVTGKKLADLVLTSIRRVDHRHEHE